MKCKALGISMVLALSLKEVPENLYHTRWGNPTLLGSIQTPANLFAALS